MNHESNSASSHFSRRALIKGAAAAAAYTLLPKFATSDALIY
jgi:TAT (twin-arginine translocation) pathway signal sequence